ncbi:LysE family translocator [Corynebacterium hansenii]|uniref:LysE family translocator n=1 Tax=Corynebacterium hansenii TaxID=394964 RepID=A0ABV7ZTV0_9CORY|nr:LysE family translocator [Corynebacterium hansenii]WJZ01237.1 Threonine efflux protein [Corynebacterium hansenii]
MNWAAFTAMLGIHVVGMTSPGPDVLLILRMATRSRKHALAAVAGIVTGLTAWVTLTVVGVAAVLSSHPALMGAIQLLGGGYLAYMGARMLAGAVRGIRELRAGGAPAVGAGALGTVGGAYRQGLLTNLSNPKVVLFFAAVLSQFMPVGAPWWVQAVYVAALLATSVLWFGFIAVTVSTEPVVRRLVSAGPWIDLVAGVVFGALGVSFLWQGLTTLT